MAERMAGQELLVDAVAEAERETSGVCGAAPDSQCFSQTELKSKRRVTVRIVKCKMRCRVARGLLSNRSGRAGQ